MQDKYVSGFWFNEPRPNAPDFIDADINMECRKMIDWLNKALEQGYEKVRLDVKKGKDGEGRYYTINWYKPDGAKSATTQPQPYQQPATQPANGGYDEFNPPPIEDMSDIPF